MTKNTPIFLRWMFVFTTACVISLITGCSDQNKVKGVTPKFVVASNNLMKEFSENEQLANTTYVNEVIEVFGKVKDISKLNNRLTIILETDSSAGIICDLNLLEQEQLKQIKKNQLIHIKGICKGYLKDVILLNCFIDLTNQHE
ncbi:hypothetical protein BTO06_17780 [Tenacibaculum sp. SZ-18]|uniref:OB-fold protein n=1 Tax=Tenacibaculum sp. SZ-18 TaxID=754423 RepID=UPI000C2CF1B3|nr:hypothetical protein [Tenacibaculum sp. SZ-18]AUC16882.1 hypothetical protein BTO06_17780 [Tenacibaculum sp. SZ-18]